MEEEQRRWEANWYRIEKCCNKLGEAWVRGCLYFGIGVAAGIGTIMLLAVAMAS